jgi:translation initiation factor IF-1
MSKKYKKSKKQDNDSQKEEMIEVFGTVIECLPGTQFIIELDTGQVIHGHVAGKLRKFRIRILLGDYVKIELSPYDLTKGRIIRREKGPNATTVDVTEIDEIEVE